MIKKYFSLLIATSVFFAFSSCSGWLTIKPEGEVVLEDFWQSESDVESVLASCYRGLTEDDCVYRMIAWGELRSDNLIPTGSFPNERFDLMKILIGDITSSNVFSKWGSFYSVINYCNTVLQDAPDVTKRDRNFTEGDLLRVKAEAKTLRALCYFYLIRAFKEVPWVTAASVGDLQVYDYPKSTEDVLVKNIIADLDSARVWATESYGNEAMNKGRITKNAVNALLADVYLWDNDYNNCIRACDRVLADTTVKLVTAEEVYPYVFYRGNSSESIFELQFNDDIQKNNPVRNLYGYSGDVLGELAFPATLAYNTDEKVSGLYSPFNFKVSSTLLESEDDVRALDSYHLYGGMYFIYKYTGYGRMVSSTGTSTYTYRSSTPNWIVYRLSDVLLMKAEALAQKGATADLTEAIALVNKTYHRSNELDAPLELVSYPAKEDIQKLILRERQREFLFEGKRWFDLVRLARREGTTSGMNMYVEAKASGAGISLGAPVLNAMYMPINKTELEANPNLIQNPFYEESGTSSTR